ncbi:hypothetical protein WP50_19470 [Lactiplantibacillus plantarum]|nr:hypothetical protein WP50_19470 [Lactiplantibacillus plantarum]
MNPTLPTLIPYQDRYPYVPVMVKRPLATFDPIAVAKIVHQMGNGFALAKLGPKSNLNGVIWCPTKVVPRKNPSLTVISHGRIFLIGGSSMQQRWQLTTTQVKLSY